MIRGIAIVDKECYLFRNRVKGWEKVKLIEMEIKTKDSIIDLDVFRTKFQRLIIN